jgi:hypothetical protein
MVIELLFLDGLPFLGQGCKCIDPGTPFRELLEINGPLSNNGTELLSQLKQLVVRSTRT